MRSLSQQPSNQRNTIEENTLTVSGDEMFSFKGPLIDKDGNLYIDEEYDQTYQKRLRISEVNAIQEYIQGNMKEESFSSSRHMEINFDIIDKYLNKLRYFAKYP